MTSFNSDTIGAFRDAIFQNLGVAPREIIADGDLHRFPTSKAGRPDGWYKLHTDGVAAGAYGDWRRAEASFKWSARGSEPLPPQERERIAEDAKRREVERERRADEAADRARSIWQAAGLGASATHPYLVKKQIAANGAREHQGDLIVPMTDGERILNLQRIAPDGQKRFLPGGRVKGLYYTLGAPGEHIVIVEGYATGASIYEATGLPVIVAFNAGNLPPVAQAIRERHPIARLVIAADDDFRTEGNPGITKAGEAAERVGASIAVPPFDRAAGDVGTDWNDLSVKRGKEAVKEAFTSVNRVGGREWPEPRPIPDGLLPVASFETDFLPETLAPWISDIAERMQCPPDFVGVPAIIALGSVIGRRIGIRPQAATDWTEVANLWGCIVGRPGTLKSPAAQEALKPLHRLEGEARKENDAAAREHVNAVALHKIAKEVAGQKARDAIKKGLNADDLVNIEEPEEPKAKRFVTNDTSYEALGVILADNPNGVLAFRDELVSLLKTLDREEHAGARGFFLAAWNGTQSYTFDRIIRGRTHIEAACVSLLGSTQPGRLAEFMRGAVKGGAGDDGLVQRFGLLVWPDQSPEWRDVDRAPLTVPRQSAWRTFERLNLLDPLAIGARQDDFDALPFLRFDNTAQELFREWRGEIEGRLRAGEMSPALESHLAKYRKLVPALALINHLADDNRGDVGEAALLRALAFSKYLETHARRAYAAGSEAETAAAKAIVSRIRRGQIADGFTARELWRNKWTGLTDLDAVKAGLELLCDLDWMAATTTQTGGRPRATYTANPRVMA